MSPHRALPEEGYDAVHTLLGMEAVDMAYALHCITCIVVYLCHGCVFEVVLNFILKFISGFVYLYI